MSSRTSRLYRSLLAVSMVVLASCDLFEGGESTTSGPGLGRSDGALEALPPQPQGLIHWMRGDACTTDTECADPSNCPIVQCDDLAEDGLSLAVSERQQPVRSQLGGRPALRFDGVDDRMAFADRVQSSPDGYTVVAVAGRGNAPRPRPVARVVADRCDAETGICEDVTGNDFGAMRAAGAFDTVQVRPPEPGEVLRFEPGDRMFFTQDGALCTLKPSSRCNYQTAQEFTITAAFRPTSNAVFEPLSHDRYRSETDRDRRALYTKNGILYAQIIPDYPDGSDTSLLTTPITIGERIVVVWTGSHRLNPDGTPKGHKLYVNGILVAEDSNLTIPTDLAGNVHGDGELSELAVYDRALEGHALAQVTNDLMQRHVGPQLPAGAALHLRADTCDSENGRCPDLSGNGHEGRPSNPSQAVDVLPATENRPAVLHPQGSDRVYFAEDARTGDGLCTLRPLSRCDYPTVEAFTISAVFRQTEKGYYQLATYPRFSTETQRDDRQFYAKHGTLYAQVIANEGTAERTVHSSLQGPTPIGELHIVTWTADAAGHRLYVNGELVGQDSTPAMPTEIAAGSVSSGVGEMAEFVMYGRALQGDELAQLHESLMTRYDLQRLPCGSASGDLWSAPVVDSSTASCFFAADEAATLGGSSEGAAGDRQADSVETTGDLRILSLSRDATGSYLSSRCTSDMTGTSPPVNVDVDGLLGSDTDPFQGDIAELMVFNRRLSDEELEQVRTYLSLRYGVEDANCGGSFCGDGVLDEDESCDDGLDNGVAGFCRNDCTAMCPSEASGQCSEDCVCDIGQAGCETDRDCKYGLLCSHRDGQIYGVAVSENICVPDHCANRRQDAGEHDVDCGGRDCGPCLDCPEWTGDPEGHLCSWRCPCEEGQGTCEDDSDCGEGLACASDYGDLYAGLASTADICVPDGCHNGQRDGDPYDGGELGIDCGGPCAPCYACLPPLDGKARGAQPFADGPTECTWRCPCHAGFGDCDGTELGECLNGGVCLASAGPGYGFSAETDVCDIPTCSNGRLDPAEEDIDCGPACGLSCACGNGELDVGEVCDPGLDPACLPGCLALAEGGFVPYVAPYVAHWLRADQCRNLRTPGVSTCRDVAGGPDITQQAFERQPRWSSLAGLPALSFDGVDDYLQLPAVETFLPDGYTVIAVAGNQTGGVPRGDLWTAGTDDPVQPMQRFLGFDGTSAVAGSYNAATGTPSRSSASSPLSDGSGAPRILFVRSTGDNWLEVGASCDAFNSGSVGTPSATLAGYAGSPAFPFRGELAELIVLRKRLSDDELQPLFAYLSDRYSIDAAACAGPYCGDGLVTVDEACDIALDPLCADDCTGVETCGNALVDAGETCDVALDPLCIDCSSRGTEPTRCEDGCGRGQYCEFGGGDRFGLSYTANVCIPTLCEDNLGALCGDASSPCGTCECVPDCAGKTCGEQDLSDGCGGSCGALCLAGDICRSGADCADGLSCPHGNGPRYGFAAGIRVCEDPVCADGGSHDGLCPPQVCEPNCAARTCGDDGCGGSCGTCLAGVCSEGSCAVPHTLNTPHLPDPLARVDSADTSLVGTIPGEFSVTKLGAASYRVPIEVVPGRSGLQPNIELYYDSNLKNGLIGPGWSIRGRELSMISRCSPHAADAQGPGPVRFATTDKFCLDGRALVPVLTNSGSPTVNEQGASVLQEYRTEYDEFSAIFAMDDPTRGYAGHPDWWLVLSRDGRKMRYGSDDSKYSRIFATTGEEPLSEEATPQGPNPRLALSWALDRVVDRHGSQMALAYNGDKNNEPTFYISSIRYGEPGPNFDDSEPDFARVVMFVYSDDRPDTIEQYRNGVYTQRVRRLESIRVLGPECLTPRCDSAHPSSVRSYWLEYEARPEPFLPDEAGAPGPSRAVTTPSRVAKLHLCMESANDRESLNCLRPTQFKYGPAVGGFHEFVELPPAPRKLGIAEQLAPTPAPPPMVFDVNGDGRDDRVWAIGYLEVYGGTNADHRMGFELSQPSGPPLVTVARVEDALMNIPAGIDSEDLALSLKSRRLPVPRDLNGDGLLDIFSVGAGHLYGLMNNGNLTFEVKVLASTHPDSKPANYVLTDIDSDGLPDVFYCNEHDWAYRLLKSVGNGATDWIALDADQHQCASQGETERPLAIDITQDGRPNVLAYYEQAGGVSSTQNLGMVGVHFVANGNSFDWEPIKTGLPVVMRRDPKTTEDPLDLRPIAIDLNGDGHRDMLVPTNVQRNSDEPGLMNFEPSVGGNPDLHCLPPAERIEGDPPPGQRRDGYFMRDGDWYRIPTFEPHLAQVCIGFKKYMHTGAIPRALSADFQPVHGNYILPVFKDEGVLQYTDVFDGPEEARYGDRPTIEHYKGPGIRVLTVANGADRWRYAIQAAKVFDYDRDGRDDLVLPDHVEGSGGKWVVYRGFTKAAANESGIQTSKAVFTRRDPVMTSARGTLGGLHASPSYEAALSIGDFDGDGYPDLDVRHGDKAWRSLTDEKDANRLITVTDGHGNIQSITYGRGQDIAHTQGACSYPALCPALPRGLFVTDSGFRSVPRRQNGKWVSSIFQSQTYTYAGWTTNPKRRRTLGFETIVTEHRDGLSGPLFRRDERTYDFRMAGPPPGDVFPYAGRVRSHSTTSGFDGNRLNGNDAHQITVRTEYDWRLGVSSKSRPFPFLHEQRVTRIALSDNGRRDETLLRETENSVDNYGNVDESTTTWADGRSERVTYKYWHNFDLERVARWQIDLRGREQRASFDQPNFALVHTTDTHFNDAGLLTAVIREPELGEAPGLWDEYGLRIDFIRGPRETFYQMEQLVETSHDGLRREQSFTWNQDFTFPQSATNAEGHTSYTDYDRNTGTLLTFKGPDGQVKQWERDVWGIPAAEQITLPNDQALRTTVQREYLPFTEQLDELGVLPVDSYVRVKTQFPTGEVRSELLNSVGAPVKVERQPVIAESVGFIEQDIVYDRRGRVRAVSRPYLLSDEGQGFETYAYDNYNRLIRVDAADDTSTEVLYTPGAFAVAPFNDMAPPWGMVVAHQDARGHLTLQGTGARGRLETAVEELVDDAGSSTWLQTKYRHGLFDYLKRITDAQGNPAEFIRDHYGRLQEQIEPSSGLTLYRHDGFDRVVEITDADTRTTTVGYDGLDRMVSRTDLASGQVATWTWDCDADDVAECIGDAARQHTIGRLVASSSPDHHTVTHRYYGLDEPQWYGLPASTRRQTAQAGMFVADFEMEVTYDDYQRPDRLSYPEAPGASGDERFAIEYVYPTPGILQRSGRQPVAVKNVATGQELWRLVDTAQGFRPTQEALGANLLMNSSFEPRTGRLSSIQVSSGANTIRDESYGYDPNGNLTSTLVHDGAGISAGLSHTYVYDSLNRLKTVQPLAGGASEQYAYDVLGNVLSNSQADDFSYDDVSARSLTGDGAPLPSTYRNYRPHALRRFGNVDDIQYDDAGNETVRTWADGRTRTMEYGAFNLPTAILMAGASGTRQTTLGYDAENTRVFADMPDGSRVDYFDRAYTRTQTASGTTHQFNISLGSAARLQVLHTEDGAEDKYRYELTDRLGSTRAVVNDDGDVLSTLAFSGFGQNAADPVGDQQRGFTGHLHDVGTGLVNMRGRMYDPSSGRFTSPDPTQPGHFGQSLNFYAYVNNNPLNWIDPTGFQLVPTPGMAPHAPPGSGTPAEPLAFDPMTRADGTDIFSGGPVESRAPGPTHIPVAPPVSPPTNGPPTRTVPKGIKAPSKSMQRALRAVPALTGTAIALSTVEGHGPGRPITIFLADRWPEGSQESKALRDMADGWVSWLRARGGVARTRGRGKNAAEQERDRNFRNDVRAAFPADYPDDSIVVGHVPDWIAGGDIEGVTMPLPRVVNSSVGSTVLAYEKRYGPGGNQRASVTYDNVVVVSPWAKAVMDFIQEFDRLP